MRWPDRSPRVAAAAVVVVCLAQTGAWGQEPARLGIGRVVDEADLAVWNIDVAPDGSGLPPGEGSVSDGKAIYRARCLACHGVSGSGGPMERLAGGQGTLTSADPVKTIGSYWPYATTVFDYVRRAMPLGEAQSLTPAEAYAVTAYLLALNGIVGPGAVMDAETLPKVEMPNRTAFRPDPRPDT